MAVEQEQEMKALVQENRATITPEQQKRFDRIIEKIHVALDPIESDSIITALKELWTEMRSTES